MSYMLLLLKLLNYVEKCVENSLFFFSEVKQEKKDFRFSEILSRIENYIEKS